MLTKPRTRKQVHTGRDRAALTHQNSILMMLASSRTRQTYVEKPSASLVRRMVLYCGIYGTTPPNIMLPTHPHVTSSLASVRRAPSSWFPAATSPSAISVFNFLAAFAYLELLLVYGEHVSIIPNLQRQRNGELAMITL